MKRGLLIGVGTLGSLGAVFAITPPQFGVSNSTGSALGTSPASEPAQSAAPAQTATPQATQSTQSTQPKASAPAPKAAATKKAVAQKPTNTYNGDGVGEGEDDEEGGRANATVTAPAPAPTPTKSATPTPTKTAAPAPTKTTTPVPAPAQTQSTSSNGTFVGNTFAANEYGRNWGNVHVTVTINNGKITAISGDQSPASRGYMAFNQIDPYVSGQKITISTIKSTSSSALPYVSGATFSSIAYWDSLKTALKKAGI